MARKCGICRRAGHDARNCPRKDTAPNVVGNREILKTLPVGTKYPDYFYQNAPRWVAALERAGLKTSPSGTGADAKFCGNCRHLVKGRMEAAGEPYCSLNEAAVRGDWVCELWASGTINKINAQKLGEDV
jgi:hypothetical protein